MSILKKTFRFLLKVNGFVLSSMLPGNFLSSWFIGVAMVLAFWREWLGAVVVVASFILLFALTSTIDWLTVRYKIDY